MTTHSGDGKAPECWVSVWISFFCFGESHNCESTEIHPEQTESRVRTDRWVHTDTHATCPVTFQTVPCQQQTTAVLHISHMEVLARSVIHLLSCFQNLLENVTKTFSTFPHVKLRHLLNWNTFCCVTADSYLTCSIWSLCDICVFTIRDVYSDSWAFFFSHTFFWASEKIGGFHFLARIFI